MHEELFDSFLTHENYKQMQKNVLLVKENNKKKGRDLYKHYASKFKHKEVDRELFYDATSIAYSWMPTMLKLYLESEAELLPSCIEKMNTLRNIKNYKQLETFEEEMLEKNLEVLKEVINNSVVGVSKTLHLFNPKAPIFDSRVLKSWNWFFKNTGLEIANTVNGYIKYWKVVLYWQNQITQKKKRISVRNIEKVFFDFGAYQKFRKEKQTT